MTIVAEEEHELIRIGMLKKMGSEILNSYLNYVANMRLESGSSIASADHIRIPRNIKRTH